MIGGKWMQFFHARIRPVLRRPLSYTETFQVLESRTLLSAGQFSPTTMFAVDSLEAAQSPGWPSPVHTTPIEVLGDPSAGHRMEIQLPPEIRVGQVGIPIQIDVPDAEQGTFLDAWIDWNGDGNWGGIGERVAARVAIQERSGPLIVDVPPWANSGQVHARFELSTVGSLQVTQERLQITLRPPTYPTGQFGDANPISTGAAVQFTTTADLDRDGDLDILSATFDGASTVAWHENDGAQVFTRRIITTSASEATCVIVADINRDGVLDVVVSSLGNNRIAWYENDGRQNFTQHTVTNSASNVSSLFVVDMDDDGDFDLISATKGDNVIAWFENDGRQRFQRHIVSTKVDIPAVVSAADVDRDGDMDILSASFFDDTIAWYQNDGNELFTQQIITSQADGVRGMFVVDLDNDGDQDVVSSSLYQGTIAWHENQGAGTFLTHVVSASADRASAVYAADMDGDGDLDILGASRGDMTVAWFENTGGFDFPQHTITTNNVEARNLAAGDVDGDGDLDVISASKGGNRLAWFENRLDRSPISTSMQSPSDYYTNDTTIPVVLKFDGLITNFTPDLLVIENATLTNFAGNDSEYQFELVPWAEGPVTISLPAGSVTDSTGRENAPAEFWREFTLVAPGIDFSGVIPVIPRNGPALVLAPEIAVEGSRLGGGKLVVAISRNRKAGTQFDVLDDSGLTMLGTLTRTISGGNRVTVVTLNPTSTAADIQTALRQLTFRTSQPGPKSKSRQIRIQLTDAAGDSGPELVQTIHVSRKRLFR